MKVSKSVEKRCFPVIFVIFLKVSQSPGDLAGFRTFLSFLGSKSACFGSKSDVFGAILTLFDTFCEKGVQTPSKTPINFKNRYFP